MAWGKRKQHFLLLFFIPAFLVFPGCSRDRVWELKKERLFSIPIGNGEENIGVLLKKKSGHFVGPEYVLFKNGFFYIVDTVNQKILKITTPGDVILTIAKGEIRADSGENVLRTKQRKHFNFNQIGRLTVDSENNVYVEDKFTQEMPEEEEIDLFSSEPVFEEEDSEIYVSSILKFDRLGNFLFRIGKVGRDTEPFYYVYRTDVNKEGDLIVLSTDEAWETWYYHKFSSEGELLLFDSIRSEKIIGARETLGRSVFIMDAVPACSSDHLIFWVSLYETSRDTKDLIKEEELWGEEIEIEDTEKLKREKRAGGQAHLVRDLLNYRLLFYNLDSKKVDRTYRWETRAGLRKNTTEEFIGIDGETNGFLWKYVDPTKAIITIFHPNGGLIARRSLLFDNNGLWTNIGVAVDGSVSALKMEDGLVHFYRWRSDRLISKKREKVTLGEFIRDKIEGFKNANR